MPLYEYQCKDCGEEFERRLSFSEADQLPDCPACTSGRTQKKLSRVVFLSPAGVSAGAATASASCGSSGPFT